MARKLWGLLALIICLMGLTGCAMGSVSEMYALPKSSEAYVNLQAKINREKGSAEYIAPLSGDNRQTIQLQDVDGDGLQEAVAFFRDPKAENPLQIVIFKLDEEGEYQVLTRIQGVGSEIESIAYLDLCGSQGSDILVSWQAGPSVHTLVGYSLSGGEPVEILRTGYSQYLAADLDEDGRQELALIQLDSVTARQRVEYYDGRDGILELTSTTHLSEGAEDLAAWKAGTLIGGVPGLFVTSYYDSDVLVTDVLCLAEDGLFNLSLAGGARTSANTFHYYAGVYPADMNGDGVTDVPVGRKIPAYGNSTTDDFWWLDWQAYGPDGATGHVMTTYHGSDGWYLEIPAEWTGEFSMCRLESATSGVRSVTFAKGVEVEAPTALEDGEEIGSGTQAQPFLTICALVGADRGELSRTGERFVLHNDGATIYTGEFLPGWDCGLDEESLNARFHHRAGSWGYLE